MEEQIASCAALWSTENEKTVIAIFKRGKTGQTLKREHYHILQTFQIASFGEIETVEKKNGKYMATKESVTGIIQQAHINTDHGGEKKTYKEVCEQYGNIPRSIVSLYIVHCECCVEKRRRKETAAGVVVRPLSVRDLNERGQVDLVDMQTMKDGSYRFILHYMEYLTKFHVIRPLKSKTAADVANELLFIFLDIGAPHILQSDNGREFTAEVIQELASLWPELILVNGRPRHPQSQGSIERGNGDMKLKLMAWIRDNICAKWSYGVRFVQWAMNSSYHEAIKMTPYQALTGNKPRCGLKSNLPDAFISKITSGIEEELGRLIKVPLTGDSARDDPISNCRLSAATCHGTRKYLNRSTASSKTGKKGS
ncbi:KRAB-A domain-containing protein 2-like [Macrobrachium nipponense]|uniref:KRAB-A domain-containing protein 2-like n=1 Tax=Macrobrachium nipponense TaxID=159736 RepID=UPI0030C83519